MAHQGGHAAAPLRLLRSTEPDDLFAEWDLWMRAQGLAERTRTERARIITAVVRASEQHPAEFTHSALISWLASIPGDSSRLTYFRALQAWHRWLLAAGHRDDDPTLRLPKPREPKRVPHPTSTEGLAVLLRSGIRRKTKAMVLVAAYSGLRVHEIAKIRGEDIDLVGHRLRVVGKGGTDRWLPLHPVIAGLATTFPRRGYWFPSPKYPTRPMRRDTVSSTISRAMERAGIPGTAHSIRHWFATANLDAGANLRVVQELMRHGSLTTTQLYTRVRTDQMMDAVLALPDLASGAASLFHADEVSNGG